MIFCALIHKLEELRKFCHTYTDIFLRRVKTRPELFKTDKSR